MFVADDEFEYTEPTNEQLARFLVVSAKSDPRMEGLDLSPPILESLLSQNPRHREAALRKHRQFQEQVWEISRLLNEGKLQCEHILQSGKQCPNRNEPGIIYCGLHKEQHEEGTDQDPPRSLE
jgi:hypothetical protein